MEKSEFLCTVDGVVIVKPLIENSMVFLKKLKLEPPYGSSIPLLGK